VRSFLDLINVATAQEAEELAEEEKKK